MGAAKRRVFARRVCALLASIAGLSCNPSASDTAPKVLPLAVISVPATGATPHALPAEPPTDLPVLRGDGAEISKDGEDGQTAAKALAVEAATDGAIANAAARTEAARAFDRAFPLHGQAFHVLAQVFAEPDASSHVLGYFRRGARMRARRVGTAAQRGRGCAGAWHALSTGGFVCPDRGFILSRTAPNFAPAPPPPQIHAPLPYRYFKNAAQGTPQYWREPTTAEQAIAKQAIAEILADRSLASAHVQGAPDATPTEASPERAPIASGADSTGSAGGAAGDDRQRSDTAADTAASDQAADTPGAKEGRDPRLPDFVRMPMDRGFFISRGTREPSGAAPDASHFVRTVRGAHVDARTLVEGDPPAFRGHALNDRTRLPLGLIFRGDTPTTQERLDAEGYLPAASLGYFDAVSLAGRGRRIGKRHHQLTRDGRWVPTRALRIARLRERPALIPRAGRWVHIDLAEQVLVAYEGDTPVYATLVSTGKPGHETPTGLYRIQAKHLSTTMDGSDGAEEAYSIEDVPWTMYFKGSFALHGAFWHRRFGRVRSHGCVNLTPADARHLFEWSTPVLPAGWHGVLTQPKAHSTYVLIE